jgi:hypothetical protein
MADIIVKDSIQDAVYTAGHGSTIVVPAGTYNETVFIDGKLNLTFVADGKVKVSPERIAHGFFINRSRNIRFTEGFAVTDAYAALNLIQVGSIKGYRAVEDDKERVHIYHPHNSTETIIFETSLAGWCVMGSEIVVLNKPKTMDCNVGVRIQNSKNVDVLDPYIDSSAMHGLQFREKCENVSCLKGTIVRTGLEENKVIGKSRQDSAPIGWYTADIENIFVNELKLRNNYNREDGVVKNSIFIITPPKPIPKKKTASTKKKEEK